MFFIFNIKGFPILTEANEVRRIVEVKYFFAASKKGKQKLIADLYQLEMEKFKLENENTQLQKENDLLRSRLKEIEDRENELLREEEALSEERNKEFFGNEILVFFATILCVVFSP